LTISALEMSFVGIICYNGSASSSVLSFVVVPSIFGRFQNGLNALGYEYLDVETETCLNYSSASTPMKQSASIYMIIIQLIKDN
jgi:hypothetical protein